MTEWNESCNLVSKYNAMGIKVLQGTTLVVIPFVDIQPGAPLEENYLLSPTYKCGTNGGKTIG